MELTNELTPYPVYMAGETTTDLHEQWRSTHDMVVELLGKVDRIETMLTSFANAIEQGMASVQSNPMLKTMLGL